MCWCFVAWERRCLVVVFDGHELTMVMVDETETKINLLEYEFWKIGEARVLALCAFCFG